MLFAVLSFASAQTALPEQPVAIRIDAKAIACLNPEDPSLRCFGSLEFRGGLDLSSESKSFGGLSALLLHPDGERFLALSDRAYWVRGRVVYEADRPVGIADASSIPVLDHEGKPAPRWDTESFTLDGNALYVGLERTHDIFRFDFDWKGFPSNPRPVPAPPELKDLPFNQGLEGMVFVPATQPLAGTLIGFSEQGLTAEGNLKAFLIGGKTPGVFSVRRSDGYSTSDAAILPGGDILILERQYSLERGVSMRLRRLRQADIRPGALVDGPTVIETGVRYEIDNMEAISVTRSRSGETVLTLMSDNNFSAIQRTLLLQFTLKEN